MGGLLQPDSPHNLSLEQGLAQGFIDTHTRQSLSELQNALVLVENSKSTDDQQQNVLPVATAMEVGLIGEEVGLRILELQMNTGGLRDSAGQIMSLEQAEDKRLLTPRVLNKLQSRLQRRELINPNTAEKLNLYELQQRCVHDSDSGLLLFPVEQQPGGTVCLRSGRKVGIFRAVQEGLIDRKVTVRLLEAQLFGGGIADPRSGHRLTIEEAVRHGLLDQDLACAMLARQLQNGGILDPLSGERLDLEESIRRDLLSSRLAVLVLESLWAFMGILWPESGELLPIVEAFQQGVISGELSRNILRQRHAIGALYNPETLQVLPLNQAAEEALEPSVISSLKDIHIPDVLTSMNQSGTPSLNRLSWGSTSSTPPPSSPSPSSSTEGPVWDSTPTQGMDPEEQAKHKLLFHLMTHSYVDAHTGKRLVLLDSELVELVKATELVARDSVYRSQVEPQTSLTRDEQGKLQMVRQFSLKAKTLSEKHHEVEEESSNEVTLSKEFEMNGKSSQKERYDGENDNMPHKPSETVERDLAFGAKNEIDISKDAKVKAQKKEISDLESLTASAEHLKEELTKGRKVSVATESKPRDTDLQETTTTVGRKTVTTPLKSEGDLRLLKESVPKVAKTNEDAHSTQSDDWKGVKYSQTESGKIKQKVPITETDSKHAEPQIDVLESPVEKEEEDAKLRKLVLELKQGGLMTDEGERLLPDEAVAQGVLPGHTAVKLMAQAGLFGGFIDASSGESLSMEDVMQEGLLDEDLMWSVLKSDKTLAGVVDVDKRQICGVREAAQAGMIDPNTAARLLEAQVASGGIVDLRRDKKVSVTLAANLGLIEENQRDELMALEKAYKGKDTDSATALTKASLQLQMEGVIDPESKSPVPLEQAIQKGLIQSKEAYQVLARQVAEGGIVHHASGLRLSVSDAVDRGLVDRSIAPGLEELEWVYQGRVSPSSHPEAVNFQASTGAILDPESGCKLTLTEAVSKGLLDEDIASEAMASSTVTQGVLDPQTARIVPYLELVNQGTIDIETGKRFLEVKPFRGVHDVQTRENLTVPEAVASKQVDPVPALRLLQSQANSGGIIDISTGERLPLMEACNRGLVGDKMVREIAINQFLKGGLVDPVTGQQVSSLNDAIAKGLISRDIASDIQEKLAFVEMEVEEGSATPVASSSDTYSPSIIMSVSCPDSPENLSDVNTERSSTSTLSKTGSEITDDDGKTLTSVVSDQPTLYDPTEEDKVEVPVEEKTSVEPDQSLDLLSKFAINVEKRIQKTIEEIVPQEDTNKPEPLPTQKLDEKLQTGKSQTNKKQKGKDLKDSVAESIQTSVHDTDKNSQEQKGDTILKSKDTRDDRQSKGSTELSQWSEEVLRKIDVAAQKDDDVDESGTRVETEKPLEVEIKSITDVEQSDDILTSRVTQSKSKKKRKNKKNGKGKEAESETLSPEIEHLSQIDQADAHIEWQTEAIVVTNEPVSQEKNVKSQIGSQADSTRPPSGQSEVKDKKKIEAENNLVKQGQEAGPATLEFTEDAIEPEKDVVKTIMLKDTEGGVKKEKMTREHQKVKVGEKVSVSQQPEQTDSSQEVKKNKEQELPQKSNLPDNEKAALILKAKESILKKVFEKGVSEKQTAEELQALRSEVTKKESRGTSVEDVKTPTLPSKIDGVESHDVKDDGVKRPSGPPRDKEEELSVKEHKMGLMGVKEDTAVEQRSVKEDRETKLLEVSSDEREHKMGFGKEDIQNNIEATPSLQPKETQQSKRSRKNKKSKSQKMTDKTEPDIETILTPEKDDSEVTSTKMITKSAMTEDQRMDGYSNSESASDVIRPIVGKEANEEETSENDAKEAETSQQSQINLHQSEEPSSPSEEHIESTEATSEKEESQESPLETKNAGESIDGSQEITTCKPDIQPTAQSMVPGTQTGKKTGKSKKKKKLQPEVKSVSVAESKSLKDQQQNLESPGSAEEASTESDSPKVPESDTATESWKEGEDDVRDSQEVIKEVMTPKTGKVRSSRSSEKVPFLKFHKDCFRRECLLHLLHTHLNTQ